MMKQFKKAVTMIFKKSAGREEQKEIRAKLKDAMSSINIDDNEEEETTAGLIFKTKMNTIKAKNS